jgi:hypothetical protein
MSSGIPACVSRRVSTTEAARRVYGLCGHNYTTTTAASPPPGCQPGYRQIRRRPHLSPTLTSTEVTTLTVPVSPDTRHDAPLDTRHLFASSEDACEHVKWHDYRDGDESLQASEHESWDALLLAVRAAPDVTRWISRYRFGPWPAPNYAPLKTRQFFWLALRDGQQCRYCRRPMCPCSATIDHLTPRGRGGTSDRSNLGLACVRCNSAKGERTEAEYTVLLTAVAPMSFEAYTWALNLAPVPMDPGGARKGPQPSSACAFVLAGLANHANPDGTDAFPGVPTLMRYTRLSERTVRTCLDRLEEEGVIKPGDRTSLQRRSSGATVARRVGTCAWTACETTLRTPSWKTSRARTPGFARG